MRVEVKVRVRLRFKFRFGFKDNVRFQALFMGRRKHHKVMARLRLGLG